MAVPDKTPAFRPEDCPHCGAKVWHRLSRIDPWSMLEEDFLKEHTVDYENRRIERKDGKEP